MPEKPPFRYRGFASPTYTPVPDDLFDVLAPELTEAELRVLLYIIRRTFGFKRDEDAISLSQLVDGITTRDGRVLDRGTGMSRRGVMKGCAGLIEKGVIAVQKQLSAQGDNEINIYSLRFRAEPEQARRAPQGVGNEIPYGREQRSPGVGNNVPPQETVLQKTVEQEVSSFRNDIPTKINGENTQAEERAAALSRTRPGNHLHATAEAPSVSPARVAAPEAAPRGPEALGAIIARRRGGRPTVAEREARQVVQDYIEDFARELGDTAPLKSSTTRAINLMTEAGITLNDFIGALYEARSITKERTPHIRAEAKEGAGMRRKSKMGYFFSVLEDVLGLKPAE